MVSAIVIHVITWITTHLPTPKGWKAELAWLVDSLRTLYPQSGHMSTIDQAEIREVRQPKTEVLTDEPCCQLLYLEQEQSSTKRHFAAIPISCSLLLWLCAWSNSLQASYLIHELTNYITKQSHNAQTNHIQVKLLASRTHISHTNHTLTLKFLSRNLNSD